MKRRMFPSSQRRAPILHTRSIGQSALDGRLGLQLALPFVAIEGVETIEYTMTGMPSG
jgi:hypothetical protein